MTEQRPPRLRLGVLDILGIRYSLLDDAGVKHAVHMSHYWGGWWKLPAPLKKRLFMPRQLAVPGPELHLLRFGVGALFIIVVLSRLPTKSWFDPFVVPLALLISGLVHTYFSAARFRARSREYVRLMKIRALCPVCIYSLQGMETDSEHMVTCPECGARWRFGDAPQ